MPQESAWEPEPLDYGTAGPGAPDRLSVAERVILAPAAVPLLAVLGYRLAVVFSPWTWDALCVAADDGPPISAAATRFTEIGASIHFASHFASIPLGLAAAYLCLRALVARRARSAIIAAVMAVSCISSFLLGTEALSLAGF